MDSPEVEAECVDTVKRICAWVPPHLHTDSPDFAEKRDTLRYMTLLWYLPDDKNVPLIGALRTHIATLGAMQTSRHALGLPGPEMDGIDILAAAVAVVRETFGRRRFGRGQPDYSVVNTLLTMIVVPANGNFYSWHRQHKGRVLDLVGTSGTSFFKFRLPEDVPAGAHVLPMTLRDWLTVRGVSVLFEEPVRPVAAPQVSGEAPHG